MNSVLNKSDFVISSKNIRSSNYNLQHKIYLNIPFSIHWAPILKYIQKSPDKPYRHWSIVI